MGTRNKMNTTKNTTTMTNDTTENLHEAAAKGHTETLMEMLDKRIADFEKNYELDYLRYWDFSKPSLKNYPFHLLPRYAQYIVELLARDSSI